MTDISTLSKTEIQLLTFTYTHGRVSYRKHDIASYLHSMLDRLLEKRLLVMAEITADEIQMLRVAESAEALAEQCAVYWALCESSVDVFIIPNEHGYTRVSTP